MLMLNRVSSMDRSISDPMGAESTERDEMHTKVGGARGSTADGRRNQGGGDAIELVHHVPEILMVTVMRESSEVTVGELVLEGHVDAAAAAAAAEELAGEPGGEVSGRGATADGNHILL